MPYRENPKIDTPADWGHTIWRYLSTSQLIAILENDSLWFTRTDEYEDPWEGELPGEPESYLDSYTSGDGVPVQSMTYIGSQDTFRLNRPYDRFTTFKKSFFHNSWNYKEYESKAMWDGKSMDGEGVAIRTTAENLKEAFSDFEYEAVFIGMVDYGNYDEDVVAVDESAWLNVHLHKPAEFKEEQELRASLSLIPVEGEDTFFHNSQFEDGETVQLDWDSQPKGVNVPIDVNALIEEVYLSPYSASWQKDAISKLLETHGVDATVSESTIFS